MKPDGSLTGISLLIAILTVIVFVGVIVGLAFLKKFRYGKRDENGKRTKKLSFGLFMLVALALGTLAGLGLKLLWSAGVYAAYGVNQALVFIEIPQVLFLRALEMVVVPLVIISIVRSLLKAGANKQAGKSGIVVLSVLILTVAASGAIGYFAIRIFNPDLSKLTLTSLAGNKPTSLIDTIKSIVPNNLTAALSVNNALPIVFLGALIAAAAVMVKKETPQIGGKFESAIEVAYEIVGTIVDIIIKFTPYGVLSMVAVQVAINPWSIFGTLGIFIVAFYAGLAVIAIMHMVILLACGVNLKDFFKKTGNTFLFAMTSLSSMATLPLNIRSQKSLGVEDSTANLAGTLSTCIGQNACAGLYPAMLATIVALFTGINPWTWQFGLTLVIYTAISSIGVAGVGGGNIQASLLLLSMMGLDFRLITLFLSIDFILSLGRPPINVSGGIVAGVVAQKVNDISAKRKLKKTQKIASDNSGK